MPELIITEKPSSAKKVAEALAEGKLEKKKSKKSFYYEFTRGKKKIYVTPAVGHLFGLVEKKKHGWTYPVFDIEWHPSYESGEAAGYTKDYVDTIAAVAKKADEFTIACDYDVEGEVIGWNIIRFICRQKDANRMKFSTLTKPDLIEAYEKKLHHLDWGQAHAGETRHELDWFYGINLSRALTTAVKAAGSFKVMSSGRVQGPALKLLADREAEIHAFLPTPYWELWLHAQHEKQPIEAQHHEGKFLKEDVAKKILTKIKDEKNCAVQKVERIKRLQAPPYPFDLTTLQSESYNLFHITPKQTLAIAQSLYLAGCTSYPRTSSQQLDPKLGFKKILTDLSRQPDYEKLCKELLSLKQLQPNNGKKTDPAHPAIFPTGVVPKTTKPQEKKIYDLIVKRFMATFAQPAVRETMTVTFGVKQEEFIAKGSRTLEEQWHAFYKPYVKVEEITFPDLKEKQEVAIKKIEKLDKETTPPNRYNQSSIIKELEKRNLGTKATRADILDRLFERGYIEGVQITVSKLGMETVKVLHKYAPEILDEKLTADFEESMEHIREGKEKPAAVLEKAKKVLTELLAAFKKKEILVGKELLESIRSTQEEQNYIGSCPSCKEGRLFVKFGKFGKFIACGRYPDCKTTFKVPQLGMIRRAEEVCDKCGYPQLKLIKRGTRTFCINPQCISKVSPEENKEIKLIEQQKIEKNCPDCGKLLVVRRSFYGSFLGCSGYPQCKHTEKLEGEKKEKEGGKSKTKTPNV